MADGWKARITADPAVLCGKPVIRGMRISVGHILRALAAGIPEAELLAEYPGLQAEDFRACQTFCSERGVWPPS